MQKIIREFRRLDVIAFRAAVAIVFVALASLAWRQVEAIFWPVVGPLEISNIRAGATDFEAIFDGSAVKHRDCTWVESRWYVGLRGAQSVRTAWQYSGPPLIRTEGVHNWTDMTIQMSYRDLIRNSHADVVHKCPRSMWLTVTPFYDADANAVVPDLSAPSVRAYEVLERQLIELQQQIEAIR